MDKNAVVGFGLIFILLFVWARLNTLTQAEIDALEAQKDSIAQVERLAGLTPEEVANLKPDSTASTQVIPSKTETLSDSAKLVRQNAQFGAFGALASGTEELQTLQNDLFKVTFTNKGGRIKEVELFKYKKMIENEERETIESALKLMNDDKNKFEYAIPVAGVPGGKIKTGDLYFTPAISGNTITFTANGNGQSFEQKYSIGDGYNIAYDIKLTGAAPESIELQWDNYLDKLENNTFYEMTMSSVYFKPADDGPDYCNCRGDEIEKVDDEPLKWISHSNQFFNASLIANSTFNSGVLETKTLPDESEDLKLLRTTLSVPMQNGASSMAMYIGPNEYDRLRDYKIELENIIPFGWSIFGTVNRWIIRPLFNFLSSFIGGAGFVILALTFLVKMVLYPLTYKMLYSQSKMAALKPQLEKMTAKFKDDPQAKQMESMKLYREYGVSPLGGCWPMFLQMPIWIALYRFFPASIEFRQAPFLWANDLSSYDAFFQLPFELPFGMGAHISLFTLLWAVTTLIYTFYNTRHMDMSAQPAMKYMQYMMPVMFMGFFNSFAAGLTCYMFFNNIFSIGQTVLTKKFVFNNEKILAELEEHKKKPKKKGGFQTRLEEAMKQQQALAEQQKKKAANAKKKKYAT